MAGWVTRQFGTPRGAVRLALSYLEVASGRAAILAPDPAAIRRLVFVCHGNICRSAYADVLARRAGWNVASFGLSTSHGKSAFTPVIDLAAARGVDLSAHRTTQVQQFRPQPGDYLLGMETRHLRQLAEDVVLGHLPRGLLGRYAAPPVPHLHDPYLLDPAYLATCLTRIEDAVSRLCAAYPAARAS